MKELLAMKDLTVKEFIEKIKSHPTLGILITTAGVWIAVRFILLIVLWGNLFYVGTRIINLVLG